MKAGFRPLDILFRGAVQDSGMWSDDIKLYRALASGAVAQI